MSWFPDDAQEREFDRFFDVYATVFFYGLVAWPWFKAQAIAESGLDPDAVSPAGARGLMQVMPKTARGIGRRLQLAIDPFDPQSSILFGISYDRQMWDIFRRERGLERLRFMFGAYNAGAGNIIRAQKLAGEHADNWEIVSHELLKVTGSQNGQRTINYVRRIEAARIRIIDD